MRRRAPISVAILFFVFACMFSVVLWPEVSSAAKLAFFFTGIGCGGGLARSFPRRSEEKQT